MNIKKGDHVKIMAGNDKGKEGKVLSVFPKTQMVVVDGAHLKKKHVRPRQQGKKGELVRVPLPFPASRVMLLCPRCGKAIRVGWRTEGENKHRVCKKCGAEV